MKAEHKDFIGTYTDVFPSDFCDHIVSNFENSLKHGAGLTRQESEGVLPLHKSDTHIFYGMDHCNPFSDYCGKNFQDTFWDGMDECIKDYGATYPILLEENVRATSFKLQKVCPGEGYHVWHCEHTCINPSRVVAFMLYLNTLDDEECGETEFLHQQTRVRPVENTVLLWPAAYTHTHRGNPVYGNKSKYVITGWFSYT